MKGITWKELKAAIEAAGATDESVVALKISYLFHNPSVGVARIKGNDFDEYTESDDSDSKEVIYIG